MSTLSESDVSRFRDGGFVVVRGLLTADETNRMADAARNEFETHRHVVAAHHVDAEHAVLIAMRAPVVLRRLGAVLLRN